MSDPKSTILSLLDDIATTKDDGATPAVILYVYGGGPEYLDVVFATYDVVVSIMDARTRPERHLQDKPTYYPSTFPVHVLTVDKRTAPGVLVCTGTKMQWKMKAAIRAKIASAAQTGAYTLRDTEEQPNVRWVAGREVWESIYSIEHKEA